MASDGRQCMLLFKLIVKEQLKASKIEYNVKNEYQSVHSGKDIKSSKKEDKSKRESVKRRSRKDTIPSDSDPSSADSSSSEDSSSDNDESSEDYSSGNENPRKVNKTSGHW